MVMGKKPPPEDRWMPRKPPLRFRALDHSPAKLVERPARRTFGAAMVPDKQRAKHLRTLAEHNHHRHCAITEYRRNPEDGLRSGIACPNCQQELVIPAPVVTYLPDEDAHVPPGEKGQHASMLLHCPGCHWDWWGEA